jgi:hypothetical protein
MFEKLFPRLLLPMAMIIVPLVFTVLSGGSISKFLPSWLAWESLSLNFRQQIILVAELPDVPEAQDSNGHHLDLAFHQTYNGGEWVARVSDVEYYALTPELQAKMLQLAHLDKLPEAPRTSWWNYFTKINFALAIVPLSILGVLIAKFLGLLPKPPSNGTHVVDQMNANVNRKRNTNNSNPTRLFGRPEK